MPVLGFDHVNIRTTNVEASAQFYIDLLDFEFRHGPVVMGQRGNWLCDKSGNPIIHFRVIESDATSTGPIDHVALRCSGKADVLQRLKARNIEFKMAENLTPGITQIFVRDPHGVSLELSFHGE
jgi:catechol 2,3-dioxygenase-like lactoylglutathione lyase family enzyme